MNDILIRPIISEKSMNEAAKGRFTFEVFKFANKPEIALAVKQAFKVNPIKVQTISVKGKTKRSAKTRKVNRASDWKKAIIQLKAGEKIDLFDVVEKPNA
jgi:large subunit ribosomal protein L23